MKRVKEFLHDFRTDPLYYVTWIVSLMLITILFMGLFISTVNYVGHVIDR
jgi:hypothetical protein